MGPKNKGSITRRADFGRTPISDIFRGQLRSRVHRTGDQVTDNVQPFFTLQLDIEVHFMFLIIFHKYSNTIQIEVTVSYKINILPHEVSSL